MTPPRKDSVSTASPATVAMSGSSKKSLPPVLGRLLSGTFWLALRVPLQVVFSLWTTRLVLDAIGTDESGAYRFAWGFGFFQFLFEFGASSALQRQISDAWTRGDRDGVDRAIASGMNFYAAMAIVQVAALLGVAYWGLPHSGARAQLVSPGHQAAVAPGDHGPVLRHLGGRLERAPGGAAIRLRAAVRAGDHRAAVRGAGAGREAGFDFFWIVATQTAIQVGLGLGPALWVMVRELDHVAAFPRRAVGRLQGAGAHQLLHGVDPDQRRARRQDRHHDPRLHAPRTGRARTSPSTTS